MSILYKVIFAKPLGMFIIQTMKTYSINYQLANDIDWFLIDKNDTIAHFASGAGILPDIIADNAEATIAIKNYLQILPANTTTVVNPTLSNYWPHQQVTDEGLSSFRAFSEKGILSFDKTDTNHPSEIGYHLMTLPNAFLDVSTIPQAVMKALETVRVQFDIRDFYKIDEGFIPWSLLFSDYTGKLHFKPVKKKKTIRFW